MGGVSAARVLTVLVSARCSGRTRRRPRGPSTLAAHLLSMSTADPAFAKTLADERSVAA